MVPQVSEHRLATTLKIRSKARRKDWALPQHLQRQTNTLAVNDVRLTYCGVEEDGGRDPRKEKRRRGGEEESEESVTVGECWDRSRERERVDNGAV